MSEAALLGQIADLKSALRCMKNERDAAIEGNRRILFDQKRLEGELERAYGYASRLFRSIAPECVPLHNLDGVLTQIDNWCAGQRIARECDEHERRGHLSSLRLVASDRDALRARLDAVKAACFYRGASDDGIVEHMQSIARSSTALLRENRERAIEVAKLSDANRRQSAWLLERDEQIRRDAAELEELRDMRDRLQTRGTELVNERRAVEKERDEARAEHAAVLAVAKRSHNRELALEAALRPFLAGAKHCAYEMHTVTVNAVQRDTALALLPEER